MSRLWVAVALAGLPALAQPVPARRASEDSADRNLSELSLEELVSGNVAAGKDLQKVAQTSAIITVLTAEEIRARGYTSIAEALRSVPGFYDVYDLATHNFGVRGIAAGRRGDGNLIKLMIDGQPVHFRPNTGNFFGEELIPLQAVDRIEIIRGPASALYGANAFLGVINVITRSGHSVGEAQIVGQGGFVRGNAGGGGGFVIGDAAEDVDWIAAINAQHIDRSGLGAPPGSPVLLEEERPLAGVLSRSDVARPKSVLAKLSLGNTNKSGRWELWGSVQNLDAVGEFLPGSVLTHNSRIARLNQSYRLSYELRPSSKVELRASAAYFDSRETGASRLDVGRSDAVLVPNEGANGLRLYAEVSLRPISRLVLTFAGDFDYEHHNILAYLARSLADDLGELGIVNSRRGTLFPLEGFGRTVDFLNGGFLAQGVYTAPLDLNVTVGARVDINSIYGTQFSPRAGLVWAPKSGTHYLKLLFGSSFKQPTAEQLFASPARAFDIQGNPALGPQFAQTLELAGGYQRGSAWGVSANLFVTRLAGRVDYIQTDLWYSARNTRPLPVAGAEAEAFYRPINPLELKLVAGLAGTFLERGDNALALPSGTLRQPQYPPFQLHFLGSYQLPWAGLRLGLEVSYISRRNASFENALHLYRPYSAPAYVFTAASLTLLDRPLWGSRRTHISLRVNNLLGTQYVDPGVGETDYPALGRTAWLTLVQGF